MRLIHYIFFLNILISCKPETSGSDIQKIDISELLVTPKFYEVPRTNDTIYIDGLANEQSYDNSRFTNYFIDIEGAKTPKYKTRAKLLWDDNFLYVYAELEEPHIWATLKQRDTVIFYNNDFEVFIDPSGTTMNYGEIEINALNTVWDLRLPKPYRAGGKAEDSWNLENIKTAVHIYGTLNNPKDIDSLWSVEMAIPIKPLSALKYDSLPPKEGDIWRLNFSRVNWDFDLVENRYNRKMEGGEYKKEYNWVWSNQKVINMHEPEKWGYIKFSDSTSNLDPKFAYEEDLEVKQAMYTMYREVLNGNLKNLKTSDEVELFYEVKINQKDYIPIQFIRREEGYLFTYSNSANNKTYSINQSGLLTIKE
ncbi:carbohydrate-binding family 9-like protein [Aegicerativicinus sediminis]|uniref:carbohydrate-binding family 9-like protein n=1 Tax=Aegicerativicinus sediminis TaxID=2893202 RepID=UPI001E36EA61|nr:carbohydrate-binding family 9-like protein [Aegicerativicinus sediminis]